LKDLVAEGGTQQQALEITGFTANDRRALYRPHWVALEGLDGQRLQERYAAPAMFRGHMKLAAWDDLQLAHYCGYLIWNYVAVPFILADSDVVTEELEPGDVHGEIWRRLKVVRLIAHGVGPNCRASSLSVRPARCSSTIWCRNSFGYRFANFDLAMAHTSNTNCRVCT
jgi:hypothetical protein